MIVQLLITVFLTASGNCLRTNQGRDFILPIPKTTEYAKLVIITDKPTEILIEGPGLHKFITSIGNSVRTQSLNIPEIGYAGSDQMAVQATAVSVTASEDIWLYVFMGTMYMDYGGFMAIPVAHLSTEYRVVTYKKLSNANNFVVVAAVEDNTTVAITVNTSPNTFCASVNASDGDVSVVMLNRGDVVGLVCEDDITGSGVSSDKDVAVVSGRDCEWDCNLLIEMMIPVYSFGTEFFLAVPELDGNFIFRIIPSILPTSVMNSNGIMYSIGDVGYIDITNSSVIIETSNPSTVIVINKSGTTGASVVLQETDMSILPSTDRYLNWYMTDEASYETAFKNTDVVSVFGKNENVECPGGRVEQCAVFQMMIHMGNVTEVHSITNLTSPRGIILYRKNSQGDMATLPLGMLFDTDDCGSSPCCNNATCEDGSYSFICNCLPGFNGTLCEFEIDECLSSPCQNNATCHDDINRFVCECKPGFSELLCETDINECSSDPCRHNGTCQDDITRFVCQCNPGFTGTLCETNIDECASNPCQTNATCIDEINRFVCQCKPGYTGALCDIDIDECLSTPCRNNVNATCQDDINRFVCQCNPGFAGTLCETDIDECASSPCSHNATCLNEINGFVCQCKQGFSGTRCEIDLDECLSSPCQTAGTCQDMPGGFACLCETGFYGTTCESVGYAYTYTRLISVDKTLMTSTGETVTDVPLETDIRFETSYTTPLVIQNTPGDNGHSDYDCVCTRYGNSSEEEVDQKALIDKIQDDLLLDKDKLLKTIIKYKTMEDDRPSARGIGSVGCMIIIVSILLVVVPDIVYILRQCDDKGNKTRPV